MVEQTSRQRAGVATLLEGLVRIPSYSRQEQAAVDWLCRQMRELGFAAGPDAAGNAVGTRGAGEREIMLLGHIDTVPGELPVQVVDGALYGRGTVDAKGPLAAFVAAGARAALPDGVRLTVVGAVEEEVMSSRGAHELIEHRSAPDVVIIGEPSGWDSVVLGYKGSLSFVYRVTHRVSHSAGPEPTAAELGVAFWNQLTAWCAGRNAGASQGFETVDCTLNGINTSSDGLAGVCELRAGMRLPVSLSPGQAAAAIESLAGGGELSISINAPAFRGEKRSPLVAAFLAAIRAEGGTPKLKVKTGTSDMNLVGPAWGCPIVAYGPGDSRLDHQPDEHVPLADLERGVAVLTAVIERLATQLARRDCGLGPGQDQGQGGQAWARATN